MSLLEISWAAMPLSKPCIDAAGAAIRAKATPAQQGQPLQWRPPETSGAQNGSYRLV